MGYDDPVLRRTDEEMIAEAYDWSSPVMAGITIESLKERGWQRLALPPPHEYAPHAEGNFPTPSGKVELMASLAAGGDFVLPLFRCGSNEHQPGSPFDPLPCYAPPFENRDPRFPLTILTPKTHAYINSNYANLPFHRRVQGEATLLMNPADAAARGITDGCEVQVFNETGSFVVPVALKDATPPGVVVCPQGAWRQHARAAATSNSVITPRFSDLGRATSFSNVAVDVRPKP